MCASACASIGALAHACTHSHCARTWQRLSQDIILYFMQAYLGPILLLLWQVQLGRKLRRSTNYFDEMREQKHQNEIVSSKVVVVALFFFYGNQVQIHCMYRM